MPMIMEKKEFLGKLKKFDVGDDFRKKSLAMIERLFEKNIDQKSQKAGMDFVLKIYKSQAEFKKKTDAIKENLKKLEKKRPSRPAKKGLFSRRK